MSDSEAMNFAYVFKDVFEEAGWVVNKGWSFSIGNAPISGIQIDVVSEESSLKEAEIIYDALKAVGLEVTGHQIPNQKANKVTLIIGSKRQQ